MLPVNTVDDTLARQLAQHRPRLVAQLARQLGLSQLALAEDAVQQACLRALQTWPGDGLPAQPAGWLMQVARHWAIDQLRAGQRLVDLPDEELLGEAAEEGGASVGIAPAAAPTGRFAAELDDDELALLFAACHAAVPLASQVAIALRTLTGLDLAHLADALLTTEAGLAQRLARARSALQTVSLAVPAGADLPPRREAVLSALWVMFGEGSKASGRQGSREAGEATASALCWEAIRLARALAAHPAAAHADADALAALLLFHGARLSGRLDEAGHIVPLPGQPRDRWDAGMLRMGLAHLQASQRAERLSRWHLLAGIAAEHALAPDYARTDWPRIVAFYAQLLRIDGSAAPRLGHAIAVAEAGDPATARDLLEGLRPGVPAALQPHTLAALARAHERLGQRGAARDCLQRAIACVRHPADARLLQQRYAALADPPRR